MGERGACSAPYTINSTLRYVEYSPIHAAKSRPDLKSLESVSVEAMGRGPDYAYPGHGLEAYRWHDDGRGSHYAGSVVHHIIIRVG
jgi:hypothetical protein